MFSCIKKQKALKTSSLSINKLPGLFNLNFCNFSHGFKYDLFVIGGGSGGLAAAKEAAKYSKKIAVADYVTPTPKNTKWGLGGTCVNVGCIPKKLYHYAALKMEDLDVYGELGLSVEYKTKEINKKYINPFTKEFIDRSFIKPVVDWEILRNKIQQYVKKLNFGHRSNLRQNGIAFYNKLAKLVDKNTIILSDDKGNTEQVTSDKILISVGGRPSYGGIKGAIENCITSDDIFSLVKPPGKTLIVGGSYIALETAGFLNGLGYETKVMVRSILLRGFDQTMANRIGSNMADHGVEFIMEAIPIEFIKEINGIKVVYQDKDGKQQQELYDTVILAVGREAVINSLNLTNLGITIQKNKIKVDDYDKTNVDGIFAIGDCSFGRPELTPPAIRVSYFI